MRPTCPRTSPPSCSRSDALRTRMRPRRGPVVTVGEDAIDGVCRAFGDAVDLKSPYHHGHAAGVAEPAAGAAERLRLPGDTVIQVRQPDTTARRPRHDPHGRAGARRSRLLSGDDPAPEILDQIAQGDKVVTRMGIPPTGRRVEIHVIDIVRLVDGRIVEHWNIVDRLGLLQQLGALPDPAAAGAGA